MNSPNFLEQNQICRVYHWLQKQQVVTLVELFDTGYKVTSLGWKKSALTGTIKASRKLSAGSGKFPPVTCGKRGQLLPAEIFDCICRYFYLRNSLPAVIAGKFARAIFTMHKRSFLNYFWVLFFINQRFDRNFRFLFSKFDLTVSLSQYREVSFYKERSASLPVFFKTFFQCLLIGLVSNFSTFIASYNICTYKTSHVPFLEMNGNYDLGNKCFNSFSTFILLFPFFQKPCIILLFLGLKYKLEKKHFGQLGQTVTLIEKFWESLIFSSLLKPLIFGTKIFRLFQSFWAKRTSFESIKTLAKKYSKVFFLELTKKYVLKNRSFIFCYKPLYVFRSFPNKMDFFFSGKTNSLVYYGINQLNHFDSALNSLSRTKTQKTFVKFIKIFALISNLD